MTCPNRDHFRGEVIPPSLANLYPISNKSFFSDFSFRLRLLFGYTVLGDQMIRGEEQL